MTPRGPSPAAAVVSVEPGAGWLVPRARGARRREATVRDVDLDHAQREAVALPPGRALLVLGEAGHGKTTVAVHRFARLYREAAAGPGEEPRAAVIVPTEGLARLLQGLLRRLGADVEATTYDAWARAQARPAFRDMPRRESEATPPAVARVKRDPALRAALEEMARAPAGLVDDDVDRRPSRSRALARRGDLQHLFGDRTRLERVARASGALSPWMIDATLDHTRVQFSSRAERALAHVDRERLVTVDRRALDDGTATADAGTVDVEDYAVLFELDRLRAAHEGRPPAAPRSHDLVLLDEAQELAPLELALVGRSVAASGTLVVAGDADQHTDPRGSFPGWEAVMRELGRPDHATARLEAGYRCPPEVVRFARAVRDGATPADPGALPVAGFDDGRALVARLAAEVRAFARRDPRASVAVVCRSPRFARFVATELPRSPAGVPARLVFDGRFLPRGPVQVTTVEETKGLEFDVVVLADAGAEAFPATAEARRAMYVAVTRARHQVVLTHVGERSPLVAAPR
jgi:DNA helicase-2/ATP-dependent DNA helicase PcrA